MQRKCAEQIVLSGMLNWPNIIDRVANDMAPLDFMGSHQVIFATIVRRGRLDGEYIRGLKAKNFDIEGFDKSLLLLKALKIKRVAEEALKEIADVEAAITAILERKPYTIVVKNQVRFLELVFARMIELDHQFFAGEFDSYLWLKIVEEPTTLKLVLSHTS